MATFLQGVKKLALECGLPSKPSSVVSQTGEFEQLVEWYKDAWTEIQGKTSWRWMNHKFSFNTVSGTETYTYSDCTDLTSSSTIDRFKRWDIKNMEDLPTIYLQSSGVGSERWLIWVPWEWFKTIYQVGSQNDGPPAHIAIDPQDQLHLGPTPNDVYVVTGDYYRSAQTLENDADVPEMPEHFHNLIVYEAMKDYALFESAQEVLVRANMRAKEMKSQLDVEQGPIWGIGAPMA